jgi:dTDP-4-dehydrorhamnose 3,5-epimerase-like enzyme
MIFQFLLAKMRDTKITDCKLISFNNSKSKINHYSFSNNIDVPFEIKRVYYIYDVPNGSERGGHGHIELQQLIIAVKGSFDILIDDSFNSKTLKLSDQSKGLLMPSGIWRELSNFSSGTICLVLASEIYKEDDYFRNYKNFTEWKL